MTAAKVYADYQTYVDLLLEQRPTRIIGFDETGNGAIAGPLAVGACALELDFSKKVKDSKRYSDSSRLKAYAMVKAESLSSKTFYAYPDAILEHGHAASLTDLYTQALTYMYEEYGDAGLYILDGNQVVQGLDIPHTALVKADDFIPAVSAASIVAKVDRDYIMQSIQPDPWHFERSKGYPTPDHLRVLAARGPIEGIHRMNIEKVQKAFDKVGWYKE